MTDSKAEFFETGFYYAHLNNPEQEQLLEDAFTGKQMKLYRKWKKEDEESQCSLSLKDLHLVESKLQASVEKLSTTVRGLDISLKMKIEAYARKTEEKLNKMELRVAKLEDIEQSLRNPSTGSKFNRITVLVYLKSLLERLETCKIDEIKDSIATASVKQIRDIMEHFSEDREVVILCCKILHTIIGNSLLGAAVVTSHGCLDILSKLAQSFWASEGLSASNDLLFWKIFWIFTNLVDTYPELIQALEKNDVVQMLMLPVDEYNMTVVALNVLARILANASTEFREKYESAIEEHAAKKLSGMSTGCTDKIIMNRDDYEWCLRALKSGIPAVVHYSAWMITNDLVVNKNGKEIMKSVNGYEAVANFKKMGEPSPEVLQLLRLF